MNQPLLPSGLMDVLPPLAAREFRLIHQFLKTFMAFGYDPVIPPLAEYAQSLLAGQGEATSHHVFRVADPLASQMLALRADITGQVARIAGGALAQAPRPLRLCYAGYTLRTAPEALKTRRQHTQVGIERFGDSKTASVSELLAISAHALELAGVSGLTIDLHFPSVMEALLADMPADQQADLREAARLKDISRLRRMNATLIADIMDCAGPATSALKQLGALVPPPAGGRLGGGPTLAPSTVSSSVSASGAPLPSSPLRVEEHLAAAIKQLTELVDALAKQQVTANITIDMLDLSGYGYYSGIGYALYWNAANLEVGRGGCYRTEAGEEAVGFTLYINDLLDHLGTEDPAPIKTIPYGTPASEAAKLQEQGFVTVFK